MPPAIKPVPHGPGILIPTPPQAYRDLLSDFDDVIEDEDISDTCKPLVESHKPKAFSEAELNDLTRDLSMSKKSAQLLQLLNHV